MKDNSSIVSLIPYRESVAISGVYRLLQLINRPVLRCLCNKSDLLFIILYESSETSGDEMLFKGSKKRIAQFSPSVP